MGTKVTDMPVINISTEIDGSDLLYMVDHDLSSGKYISKQIRYDNFIQDVSLSIGLNELSNVYVENDVLYMVYILKNREVKTISVQLSSIVKLYEGSDSISIDNDRHIHTIDAHILSGLTADISIGNGQLIDHISEKDGIIQISSHQILSGEVSGLSDYVKAKIDELDYSEQTFGTGEILSTIKQEDGKISVTKRQLMSSDVSGLSEYVAEKTKNSVNWDTAYSVTKGISSTNLTENNLAISSFSDISAKLISRVFIDSEATGIATESEISVVKIRQSDFEKLGIKEQLQNNTLYVVSADYIEGYGQQLCNITMDSGEYEGLAATKPYVDAKTVSSENWNTAYQRVSAVTDGISSNLKSLAFEDASDLAGNGIVEKDGKLSVHTYLSVSEFENDRGYLTSHQEINLKKINNIELSGTGNLSLLSSDVKLSDINNNEITGYVKTETLNGKLALSSLGDLNLGGLASKEISDLTGTGIVYDAEHEKLSVQVYTHPSHTAASSGLYKITVDDLGHVTSAISVEKSDITALDIPGQDTTYTFDTDNGLEERNGTVSVKTDGTTVGFNDEGQLTANVGQTYTAGKGIDITDNNTVSVKIVTSDNKLAFTSNNELSVGDFVTQVVMVRWYEKEEE